MAQTTVSDAQVFPQDVGTGVTSSSDSKYTSAAYFAALSRYRGDGAYVGEDKNGSPTLQFTVDTANDHLDIGTGYCYIIQDNTQVQGDSQSVYNTDVPLGVPHVIFLPTQQVDLNLDAGATNDVYISFDPQSSDNTVTLHWGSAISAPTDPHIQLGTAHPDTGATTRSNDLSTSTHNSIDVVGALTGVAHSDLSGIGTDDHHTKYTNEEAQDAVGTILGSNFTYDDAGNSITLVDDVETVAASGVVTLSSGAATVSTGITTTGTHIDVRLDPSGNGGNAADVKVSARAFWDNSVGEYKVEILEDGTTVGNPDIGYEVVQT